MPEFQFVRIETQTQRAYLTVTADDESQARCKASLGTFKEVLTKEGVWLNICEASDECVVRLLDTGDSLL